MVTLYCAVLFSWCLHDGKGDADLLKSTWVPATEAASSIIGAKTLMTEAVGIPGWEFEGYVYDEIGIVTPEMWKYLGSDGWYYRAVMDLEPDLLIVRPEMLLKNEQISGAYRPFANDEQLREILEERYLAAPEYKHVGGHHSHKISSVLILIREGLQK